MTTRNSLATFKKGTNLGSIHFSALQHSSLSIQNSGQIKKTFPAGKRRLQHTIKFAHGIPKQNLLLDAYGLPGAYCWNPHACLHKLPQTYIYNYLKMHGGGGVSISYDV